MSLGSPGSPKKLSLKIIILLYRPSTLRYFRGFCPQNSFLLILTTLTPGELCEEKQVPWPLSKETESERPSMGPWNQYLGKPSQMILVQLKPLIYTTHFHFLVTSFQNIRTELFKKVLQSSKNLLKRLHNQQMQIVHRY